MLNWKGQKEYQERFRRNLKQDFPWLYRYMGIHWRDGGMVSCSFGGGWCDLVYMLSMAVDGQLKVVKKNERPFAFQIKEKFGGLRFYMAYKNEDGSWDTEKEIPKKIRELISKVEELSLKTCEFCGQPGSSDCDYSRSWIKTLCPDCHEENKK